MSLKTELESLRADFMTKIPAEMREAITRTDLWLAASGIANLALKASAQAPDFSLQDANGTTIRLGYLLKQGPVVVSFYRGGWCPYCDLELRALQVALPAIQSLGANLVAISPQQPDKGLSTKEKNALTFPLLSDTDSNVAKSFGIAFDLAEELRPIYSRFGYALPHKSGVDDWVLPIPATYVIDRAGLVALAFVDTDYRRRLEPADIVAALRLLKGARA